MLKQLFCIIWISFIAAAPANAAPVWIERKFIADVELVDNKFLEYSETQAVTIDHSPWTEILSQRLVLNNDGVNRFSYAETTKQEAQRLSGYIDMLAAIDVTTLTRAQQLAYWIKPL